MIIIVIIYAVLCAVIDCFYQWDIVVSGGELYLKPNSWTGGFELMMNIRFSGMLVDFCTFRDAVITNLMGDPHSFIVYK